MGKILAVSNNKGGVGKTTIAANLAHAMANKNKKVLLIDADSQCNLSSFFAPTDLPQEKTFYGLLDGDGENPTSYIYLSREYERISIVANKPETAALEPDLARRPDLGWFLLRDRLRDYATENFDYTIIDTPPNLGLFSLQAMICADFILVPVEAGSRFSLDGLAKTVETIEDIANTEGVGESGRFLRLLINRADRRTAVSKISIDYMTSTYGEKVCKTIIPINTQIQQAEQIGVTVLRHDAKCLGATSIRALAVEIMGLLK